MKEEQPKVENLKDQVYSRQEYSRANFWDERYSQKSGFFDWYAEFPELKNSFSEYDLQTQDKILMVGCGNSKLSYQMHQAGYKNILSIDISPSVIQQMKQEFPELSWEVMDATKMSYKDGQFDVIIDKGTLDALISGKNYSVCHAMLQQCMRVTKQNGQLLLITYGSPQGRRKIFEPSLPFQNYDYYQCRAELNDMSTLINLMRSNLGGQSLGSIIKNQPLFAKTMKEFSIIKLMRKNRKSKKQLIIWKETEKKQVEINTGYVDQKQKKQEKKQVAQQTVQVEKQTEIKNDKQEEKQFNYQPRKQPFVYVYSIRRKFVYNFQQVVGSQAYQELEDELCIKDQSSITVQGIGQQNSPITFLTQKDNNLSILRAAKYLKVKRFQHSKFQITTRNDCFLPHSIKVHLLTLSKNTKIFALRKTNLSVKIFLKNSYKLQNLFTDLSKLPRHLTSNCNLYPCPKTFALFHILKNRNLGPTVNNLLQKYWFPTYQINQVKQDIVSLKLSIPPVEKIKQKEIVGEFLKFLKKVKVQITNSYPGYLSYLDIKLCNIASLASLSYLNQPTELILQDFWNIDQINEWIKPESFVKNNLYNQLDNTIIIPKQVTSNVIAHIIALY